MRKHVIPVSALLLLVRCGNAGLTCSSSSTLDALVMCIGSQMPASGSSAWVVPTAAQRAEIQAVAVFRDTDSRSFLMAGAHRDANSAMSTCRPSFPESDASHNSSTMVQATNEALLGYYGGTSWFAIQWHGMA